MAVYLERKPATSLLRDSSGKLIEIQHIDPDFWEQQGPIEHGQYTTEQARHLRSLLDNDGVLYHYTTLAGLHGIVNDGAIRASDVRALNDRSEIRFALNAMRDAVVSQSSLSISRKTTEQLFGTGRYWLFAACFSKSRDQLSQWRAYGSKIGVSIGFDRAHLAELSKKQNATLRDCRYLAAQMGTGDEYATDIANRLLKTGLLDLSGNFTDPASARSLQQDVLNLAAFIKHASFEEEREIRLLKPKENAQMSPFLFKSTDQTLSPFITIDIDSRRVLDGRKPRFGNCLGILEILVWPSEADEQVLDAISMLFAPTGGVTVRRSDSPYRI